MSASSPHISLLKDLITLGFPPVPAPSLTLTEVDVVLHFSIQQLVQAAKFLFNPAPTSLSSLAKANVDAAISLLSTVNAASPADGAAALATHLPHVDVIRRIAALDDPTTEEIADRLLRQSVTALAQWASAVFERFLQEPKPELRPPVPSSDSNSPATISAGSMAGPTPTADLQSESVTPGDRDPPTPPVIVSRSTPARSTPHPFSPLRARRSRHPQFFSP